MAVIQNADMTSNSVVYGFAYYGHWVWINSYKGNSRHSFVIWKDYNCDTYLDWNWASQDFNNFMAYQEAMAVNDAISKHKNTYFNDIWKLAYNVAEEVNVRPGQAYSVIVTENTP